jgi:hypothetical protein
VGQEIEARNKKNEMEMSRENVSVREVKSEGRVDMFRGQ